MKNLLGSSSLASPSRWLQQAENGTDNTNDSIDDDEKTTLDYFIIVMTNVLLFFLIFGLSATVQLKNMKEQLTNKFAIITGVAMQFVIMPILGFAAVIMLQKTDFTEAMGITLLVVTASPGGSYSNWWCSLFNAELALSVAMTTVSSILSIALLPLNLFIYTWLAYGVIDRDGEQTEGEDVNVLKSLDFGGIFISLGVVLGGIVVGLYCGYTFDNDLFHERANKFGSICGISLILFSGFLGSGGGGDTDVKFWNLPWSFYVGVAFPCILGMGLANIISRSLKLSGPETVAISVECCYQNTAIAFSVAVTMFSDPTERAQAVSVPLFYGIIEGVIIGIYCVWAWKVGWTKAPADEKLCIVISKTYETEGHTDDNDNDVDASDNHENKMESGTSEETAIKTNSKAHKKQSTDTLAASPASSSGVSEERSRLYSSDATVTTAPVSTPDTPATPNRNLYASPSGNMVISETTEDYGPSRTMGFEAETQQQQTFEERLESQVGQSTGNTKTVKVDMLDEEEQRRDIDQN